MEVSEINSNKNNKMIKKLISGWFFNLGPCIFFKIIVAKNLNKIKLIVWCFRDTLKLFF